jgi:O-antigen/teichoic acid export membrane protein
LHAYDRKSLSMIYQLSYKYLMLVGFPVGLATMLFGGQIIVLIYGEQFKEAGAVVAILAVSLLTMMSYGNGPLLNAIGKQRFFAWTQAVVIFANALFCLIFIPYWGVTGAAWATMLSSVGGFFVHSIVCHRQLGLSFPWATTIKTLASASFMTIACLLAKKYGMPWWLVALTIMPLAYATLVVLLRLIQPQELRVLAYGPVIKEGN